MSYLEMVSMRHVIVCVLCVTEKNMEPVTGTITGL
jgi:hypothetical protein